ncbi:MAG: LPS assembly lipoprotein LptE [Reyranellaceae bacterium]
MTSRRAALALFLVLPLAACGFEPLYGNRQQAGDAVFNDFHQIKVATIPERRGQMLRNELLDRLNYRGEPAQPLYELKIALREEEREVLVRSDEVATAVDMTLTANYQLVDRTTGGVLTSAAPKAIMRYNVLASPYATLSSAEDARRRAAKQLADDIRARLGVYFTKAKGR